MIGSTFFAYLSLFSGLSDTFRILDILIVYGGRTNKSSHLIFTTIILTDRENFSENVDKSQIFSKATPKQRLQNVLFAVFHVTEASISCDKLMYMIDAFRILIVLGGIPNFQPPVLNIPVINLARTCDTQSAGYFQD